MPCISLTPLKSRVTVFSANFSSVVLVDLKEMLFEPLFCSGIVASVLLTKMISGSIIAVQIPPRGGV